jgi:hypothetical protein
MTKEILTDEMSMQDVLGNEVKKAKGNDNKTLVWVMPIAVAAILAGVYVHVLLGVAVGLLAIIPIYLYFKQNREDSDTVFEVEHGAEFIVEIDTLSHIATETIYEPHTVHVGTRTSTHYTKTVTIFEFHNATWRVPDVEKLYAWSKEMYISPKGLENTSLRGDKFYIVRRLGNAEVAYVYNTKFFTYNGKIGE